MQVDGVVWCASVTRQQGCIFHSSIGTGYGQQFQYVAIKSIEATFVQRVSANHTLLTITV